MTPYVKNCYHLLPVVGLLLMKIEATTDPRNNDLRHFMNNEGISPYERVAFIGSVALNDLWWILSFSRKHPIIFPVRRRNQTNYTKYNLSGQLDTSQNTLLLTKRVYAVRYRSATNLSTDSSNDSTISNFGSIPTSVVMSASSTF